MSIEIFRISLRDLLDDLVNEILCGNHDLDDGNGELNESFVEDLVLDNYRESLLGPIMDYICSEIKDRNNFRTSSLERKD